MDPSLGRAGGPEGGREGGSLGQRHGPQGPEGRSRQEPGALGERLSGRHWGAISLPRPRQPRQPSRSAPGRPPLWYHTPPSFPAHLQHPDPRLCAHLGPTGTRQGRANLSGDCSRLRFGGAPPAAGGGGWGQGRGVGGNRSRLKAPRRHSHLKPQRRGGRALRAGLSRSEVSGGPRSPALRGLRHHHEAKKVKGGGTGPEGARGGVEAPQTGVES